MFVDVGELLLVAGVVAFVGEDDDDDDEWKGDGRVTSNFDLLFLGVKTK